MTSRQDWLHVFDHHLQHSSFSSAIHGTSSSHQTYFENSDVPLAPVRLVSAAGHHEVHPSEKPGFRQAYGVQSTAMTQMLLPSVHVSLTRHLQGKSNDSLLGAARERPTKVYYLAPVGMQASPMMVAKGAQPVASILVSMASLSLPHLLGPKITPLQLLLLSAAQLIGV